MADESSLIVGAIYQIMYFLLYQVDYMDVVNNSSHFDDKKNMRRIQILQLEISMVNFGIIKNI